MVGWLQNWNRTENCFLTTYHSSFLVSWWVLWFTVECRWSFKSSTQTLVEIELSYYKREPIRPWCSIVTHIGAKTNLFELLGSDHMLINSQGKLDTVKVLSGELGVYLRISQRIVLAEAN